ncbi:MAG: hypothetical protein KF819_33045 [Labilithrix sp.]|nr:hypothetical protein [Labilithrix sp.]
MNRRVSLTYVLIACTALITVLLACGSERSWEDENAPPAGSSGDNPGIGFGGGDRKVVSLTVDPPTASLVVESGAVMTQPFKAIAKYSDNTTSDVTNATQWIATSLQVGNIASTGLYSTTGSIGGDVKITGTFQGQKASAALRVKLHLLENPAGADAATIAALKAATTKDSAIQWAYPYDGTVFPRGLHAPLLMWNNGGAGDTYYVHVTSATFELESFTKVPPPSRYAFTTAGWQKLVDSTSGAADLTVARMAGTAVTIAVQHKWTVAPASMRGTIYYWANNQGRVMRIKPGATTPDDFSAGTFGALPASGCTMTCHTVSADGSTLVSGGDTLGGSYDLLKNTPIFDTGGAAGSAQKRLWSNPAVSPDGKYVIQNSSPLPGPPGAAAGLWSTANGTKIAGSGLDALQMGMPNFAPDGTKIAYVGISGVGVGSLDVVDFDMKTAKAGAPKELVAKGAGLGIAWPSVSPDAKWAIYHRGPLDTRDGASDLFLASTVTPNQEIRLAKLNGDGYPFAAGARDLALNFEPTFAPVPSGGYFWVVFTSRRTYGNALTGAKEVVKELWVAAIDLSPTPGTDPSHPPFLLPGQDETSLNMRGFWALDPCKGDGQGCASGTECCGGFCDGSGPAGALVCKSAGTCANDGDRCDKASDCCNHPTGTLCINHVCSEPGPK